jgi:IMP cyclohydrolase
MPALDAIAADNLRRLEANPYPGRGIVLGRSADGASLLQVYWIMGRSANSRNRLFVAAGGRLRTEPLDAAGLEHPELVIYTAMDVLDGQHVVTNGDHTETVIQALRAGRDYRAALRTRAHEPDPPHHTPRIAGGIRAAEGDAWLAIIKADPGDPARSVRQFFEYEALAPGRGWFLSTYAGDGNPLPPFAGEPLLLPLAGSAQDLLAALWGRLNAQNRVAMAVKSIEAATGRAALHIVNARNRAG